MLLLPTLAFSFQEPKYEIYDANVIKVTDGDTVLIAAPFLPKPLKPQLAVRIYGVDTPEKGSRAECPDEHYRAMSAYQFSLRFISKGTQTQMKLYGWDKYGGRVLGDILVDGQSLRQHLIANGFAREYYGEKKQSWCQ